MPPQLTDDQWRSMPWRTKNNVQIAALARKLGMASCAAPTVWHKRRKFAPGSESVVPGRGPEFRFRKIDWTQHNSVIAEKMGCSESTVAKARSAAGACKAPRKPGTGRPVRIDYEGYDPRLSNKENAHRMKCAPAYVSEIARRVRSGRIQLKWKKSEL